MEKKINNHVSSWVKKLKNNIKFLISQYIPSNKLFKDKKEHYTPKIITLSKLTVSPYFQN